MRDPAVLAIFHGLIFRDLDALTRLRDERGWHESECERDTWCVTRLGSLCGYRLEEIGALIHRPSVVGDWWFDMGNAHPRHRQPVALSALPLAAPVLDPVAADDLRSLAAHYRPLLDGPGGWQALALVDLKHT